MRYSIVGQKHLDLDPYLQGILHGTPAVLVRDPENKVDPRAIMVWIDGKHVGYIPMKTNKTLTEMIDETGWEWGVAIGEIKLVRKATNATFVRSPNSGYPMVEVPPIAVQEELKVDEPAPAAEPELALAPLKHKGATGVCDSCLHQIETEGHALWCTYHPGVQT